MSNDLHMLTKNFSAEEFFCPCGCWHGPAGNILALATRLQTLRDMATAEAGRDCPIRVTSGYRCEEHNRRVGGSPTSQHLRGNAADITCRVLPTVRLLTLAERVFGDGGIGVYPDWPGLHLDIRPNGPAKWAYWLQRPCPYDRAKLILVKRMKGE